MPFLYALLALVVIFLALIFIRALLFKPKPQDFVESPKYDLDNEKIVNDMVEMIKCKTVSNRDEEKVDRAEFEKFENLLKERFPKVHSACKLQKIGKTGLLY